MQLTDKERIDKLELENKRLEESNHGLVKVVMKLFLEQVEQESKTGEKVYGIPTKKEWQESRLNLLELYINNSFIKAGWDNKQNVFVVEFEELAKELSVKYGVYVNPKEDYRTTVKIIND